MIEQLVAKNYGCLKDVTTPKLGMLHAFIGPNDSGKSTLLRAVRVLGFGTARRTDAHMRAFLEGTFELQAKIAGGTFVLDGVQGARSEPPSLPSAATELSARLARFDPDALRAPSALIPDNGAIDFSDDRGRGLPGIYDSIVNRGDDAFAKIRAQVTTLFPAAKGLRLKAVSQSEKILEIELHDGTRVPASHMSEGLLYFLAFAALPYLSPTAIVLVEEPENGLHPARIAEVMTALRELSKSGTQVLLATHSPLVINELTGDEVSVVTRDEDGTHITLLKDTPNFEERSKVYALGELWVSYANGKDEGPLLNGSPKT